MDDLEDFKYYHYDPSFIAAIIFLALYAALALCHVFQLIRYGTFYLIPFFIGCLFETIGYIERAISAKQTPDWALLPYVLQSVLLLLGPTMLAASIYMSLGRLIVFLGADSYCLIPSDMVTKTFIIGDVISFLAQSGGASMLANAKSKDDQKMGQTMIIIGLAVQLYFFAYFMTILHIFYRRNTTYPTTKSLSSTSWKPFVLVLYADSALIMIRSIFRMVEYITGSNGELQSKEVYVYVFDAALMLVTTALFNLYHPGRVIVDGDSANISLGKMRQPSQSVTGKPDITPTQYQDRSRIASCSEPYKHCIPST
ncbi:RTA1 like protein-domain-containing protein [Fusarium avenaceum]|nr:RTA1 like protein-domain-containing protein [Fusarium avenaceum]